jgi:CubicO group peptidase (beta-lactamase class C family)
MKRVTKAWIRISAVAATLFCSGLAFGQAPSETAPKSTSAASATTPATPTAPATLSKVDVDAWLDGMMPYALSTGDIPGAVVVVVKDGQVLTERGYGFADLKTHRKVDPETTLFRPGSVTKTFTWTAVMQLVQAGKINLDQDINTYLDFKIAPAFGRPITMRDLMTHTPGFAEIVKRAFVAGPDRLLSLGAYLKSWTPNRIFPPGEVPAYSNYGATIAGYIVQRVSGEPFDQYIQHHIFDPLGMTHSSFAQPLPDTLRRDMATGYTRGSEPPHGFEFINVGPAGSLSTTGGDMSRFMIAHLSQGGSGSARILDPATEALMQAPQPKLNPPLNGMALGFYHEDRNGHVIIGHAGDTEYFHSDLHLLPNDGVGLFISMNGVGREGAVGPLRTAFLRNFMNRYYPATPTTMPTLSSARADGAKMVGEYWSSRRLNTGFLRVLNLIGQAKVTADPAGILTVSDFKDASQAVKHWREVGPFVWRDDASGSLMAAVVKNGKVVNFANNDEPPVLVDQPVPLWAQASWNVRAIEASVAILVLCVLLWPTQALVRRRYGQSFALTGRGAWLYRGTRLVALVDLIGLVLYAIIFSLFMKAATAADDPMDGLIRVAQIFCALGVLGVIVTAWNLVTVWTRPGRSWWASVSSLLLFLATLDFAWIVFSLQLVAPSLNY